MVLAASACHHQQTPTATLAASAPAIAAPAPQAKAAAKPWFTCRSTMSAVDFVASEPGADHTFTLQERERASGKVVHEYALAEGEGSAGAGHVFSTFLSQGQDFGGLGSVNGSLLDPPVEGTVPSELRIGQDSISCEPPAAAAAKDWTAASIQGAWSFDGSCASGDGMILRPDGSASFDENGEGRWQTTPDHRLLLALQLREMGDGNAKPVAVDYVIEVTQLTADRLVGSLTDPRGQQPVRPIDARHCSDTK